MRQGLWRGRGRRKEEISQWGESGGSERGPSFCSLLVLPPPPATLLPTSPFPELTTVSETRHTYRRSCHRRQAPRWAVCAWGLGAGGSPHVGVASSHRARPPRPRPRLAGASRPRQVGCYLLTSRLAHAMRQQRGCPAEGTRGKKARRWFAGKSRWTCLPPPHTTPRRPTATGLLSQARSREKRTWRLPGRVQVAHHMRPRSPTSGPTLAKKGQPAVGGGRAVPTSFPHRIPTT